MHNNDLHYDNCNGKTQCVSRVTRMLTPTSCTDAGREYPISTNYMVIEYYCIPGRFSLGVSGILYACISN